MSIHSVPLLAKIVGFDVQDEEIYGPKDWDVPMTKEMTKFAASVTHQQLSEILIEARITGMAQQDIIRIIEDRMKNALNFLGG